MRSCLDYMYLFQVWCTSSSPPSCFPFLLPPSALSSLLTPLPPLMPLLAFSPPSIPSFFLSFPPSMPLLPPFYASPPLPPASPSPLPPPSLPRFITQEGHKLEVMPNIPAAVTNAVSWRKEGIRYRKNEVFLDVIESVNLLVSHHLPINTSWWVDVPSCWFSMISSHIL